MKKRTTVLLFYSPPAGKGHRDTSVPPLKPTLDLVALSGAAADFKQPNVGT